jgi:hypothetical protein
MSQTADNDLAADEIEVRPTKALFVDMLTKDIGLNRAVIDLIDNSIDGARRLRPDENTSLDGLEITVDLNDTQFSIKDNCGGIGIDRARHYAFRIGRPKDMPSTPNSVGQFGVGMKRALFKFGREFEVTSTTATDRFSLKVDVDAWEADDTSWRFKFDSMEENLSIPLVDTGTKLVVTKLREPVSANFALENFRNALSREIQAAQQAYIDRGLRIVFDGRTLIATPWQLLGGITSGIEPARIEKEVRSDGREPVYVRIYAGIAESNPKEAGWYVFCNGRMVLEADQTKVTGWKALADAAEVAVPKYHNQFARFRGFVFFDSKEADLLPWNTTKTGVDEDSALYRSILLEMVEAMRPIIDFLNELDREKDSAEEDMPLTQAVERAMPLNLRAISRVGPFVQPARQMQRGPAMVTISYKRARDKANELQEALGARSAKETGEKSFDLAHRKYVEEDGSE